MLKKLNRFFMHFEWRLSLATVIWSLLLPAGSFAVPAWMAQAAGVFSEYAPLSWGAIGFAGLLAYSLAVFLIGSGRMRSVRSQYDAKFMQETGGVDPLSKVFEGKRIYLNDFILPSSPIVTGKTFVDCQIVGPMNLYLQAGNAISDGPLDQVDAVALSGDRLFINGATLINCSFRGCTFHRVTLFFHPDEVEYNQNLSWLNWISPLPTQQALPGTPPTSLIEDQSPQPPEDTEEETPPKTSPD